MAAETTQNSSAFLRGLIQAEQIEAFVSDLQENALSGVWSRGVALTREASFIPDKIEEKELIVRVLLRNRPVHPRVTLWPLEGDAFCDCGDRNDPCVHIIAAAIALKTGQISLPSDPATSSSESASPEASAPALNGVSYRLRRISRENASGRKENRLELERWLCAGGRETRLGETLTGFIGGIQSGRISHPTIAATQEDFKLDQLLQSASGRSALTLDRSAWARLLSLLESVSDLRLDGERVRASSAPILVQALLVEEKGGFRLRRKPDPEVSEVFLPGIARCGDQLRPVRDPELSSQERELLRGEGTFFSRKDLARLVSEILPALRNHIPVEIATDALPALVEASPEILLEIDPEGQDALSVLADLVYGNPPIARVRLDLAGIPIETLHSSSVPAQVPSRDLSRERELLRELQAKLHLQPGQRVRISGDAAPEFIRKARALGDHSGIRLLPFKTPSSQGTSETPSLVVEPPSALSPKFITSEDGSLDLVFETASGSQVGADRVFEAWRENRQFAPLATQGWGKLPADWLGRYGERALRLLEARDHSRRVPRYFVPELVSLCEESGQSCADRLSELKTRLQDFTLIPESPLPADLTITPRAYQRQGIHWLSFLREQGLGALLADDMGLGKTLQALCAIQGRTLIVCPTSVLSSWEEQIRRFRPALEPVIFHGANRKLPDGGPSVTLTTYGILRQDRELLTSREWDTVVLDEAHLIKNPESQMARAAHSLRANFRIALSGTPVENRLDDLWSQFQFLNPGLLGPRQEFLERFGSALARGDALAGTELRKRIRPFLLRRLKREVAPELPPRTEVLLHCEFSEGEREFYESILAASRSEILSQLEKGGSVFAALEALLRLRQACCHPALVPGHPPGLTSSKSELLLETLEDSIASGHRSLVFSQWTSYLDLIEPLLKRQGIDFLRLDGSTSNREEVVRAFQDPSGPPIMLLSLKAGGVGLTLTAADHVFLLDPWWNPTVEDQAADRAHRIGQTNPVLIHRLIARDTIEDRILELQREKQKLSGAVLEGSASAVNLTREDLFALLS